MLKNFPVKIMSLIHCLFCFTSSGVGPYAGIKFWCYEMMKGKFCELYDTTEKELPA